ncbi:MAG: helix-turn-helix domain-containing protein, partial [Chloroflexota bacterium]|nr:helix-turn-helix domain-containing protein [Chloroflexota bacterium]
MERSLGQVIRSRRVELGLTQQQLAERIGDSVEQSEVSRLERDQVALPRRPRMEQLARALEIPVGVL